MVTLEEANQAEVGQSELDHNICRGSRYHYYYAGHVTRFDDTTTPDAHLYGGTTSGVFVTDVSASGDTMSVTVSTAAVMLTVTPRTGLASSGTVGGPFTPDSTVCTLSCTGTQPLSWTACNTQPWLTLSKTSGTLSPGETDTVAVSIDSTAGDLADGSYSDTVTFTNTTNNVGDATWPVTVTVTAGGCGKGVGSASLASFYVLCWAGLLGLKSSRRFKRDR